MAMPLLPILQVQASTQKNISCEYNINLPFLLAEPLMNCPTTCVANAHLTGRPTDSHAVLAIPLSAIFIRNIYVYLKNFKELFSPKNFEVMLDPASALFVVCLPL